jgi:hypothetical protein
MHGRSDRIRPLFIIPTIENSDMSLPSAMQRVGTAVAE